MKPLLVTSGEPAGIGPEICLALRGSSIPVVILADANLLLERAKLLGIDIFIREYNPDIEYTPKANYLTVLSVPTKAKSVAGQLDKLNSLYVLEMLQMATELCIGKKFSGLVTAPVHKGIINQVGISFTGHTEFLLEACDVKDVVMMLASDQLRVALVTTHLPLKKVSASITKEKLSSVLTILNNSLKNDFGIMSPNLYVSGLNPHAGEEGYLGSEEIEIISPALEALKSGGLNITGPLAADTMFSESNLKNADAFVAMYHDQGLTVLKYASFGSTVNITLGLPIIRTSVDHGSALDIAG